MIGFLIRKTFYDIWDNMFRIVLLNLGLIAVIGIPVGLYKLITMFNPGAKESSVLWISLCAFAILLCLIYLSAATFSLRAISDYGTFGFRDFIGNIKKAWPSGIAMFVLLFAIALILTVVIPFYFSMDSLFGMIPGMIITWALFFAVISFQFYFTVYIRLGGKIFKSFKKCLIITFDNTGLSVFSFLYNIATLLISIPFVFMLPGPAGVLLFLDEALRLRLLKYDWLDDHPGANRKKIPWDAILIEERDKTGTRSLKNFIFPWKD